MRFKKKPSNPLNRLVRRIKPGVAGSPLQHRHRLLFHTGAWAAFIIAVLLLTACSSAPSAVPSATFEPEQPTETMRSPTAAHTSTNTPTQTITFTPTLSATPSATNTQTPTTSPSPSSTITPVPTYEILRGKVNVDRVMCFYGPHRAYLFKYGVLGGSVMDILGINTDTQYLNVQAIGGDNPCWMNLEWMDVRGEISQLEPIDATDVRLPMSPYYGPLSGVSAVRNGNEVTISWNPFYLNLGDDSEQEPYLAETWVCQNGRQVFIPLGVYVNQATVTDEPGCDLPSHGRVYAVEKHGYTRYIEVPWPDHE